MKVIYDSYAGQVVPIAYHHMGDDSAYLFNPTEIDLRAGYYGVGGAPHFFFDGVFLGNPWEPYDEWYAFVRHTIDSLLQVPSRLGIEIDQYTDADSVYVSCSVTAQDSVPGDLYLHVAALEYGHSYAYPHPLLPRRWFHILRDFVPDPAGHPIDLSGGGSANVECTYPIYDIFHQNHPSIACDSLDMITVAFVQEGGTREILQACEVFGKANVPRGLQTPGLGMPRAAPNPFRSETTISFEISQPGEVELSVYSPAGRLITRLVSACAERGCQTVTWDGRDGFGREVESGIYYYRLKSANSLHTGKAIVIR